jgi:hypothetical protein
MPILSDEERAAIQARQDVHDRITAKLREVQYRSYHCRLCNWASNGLTIDEAWEANLAHERSHPEYNAWTANTVPMSDIPKALHDHDCVIADCVCICGCSKSAGCILIFGPLCSVCVIRANRGDSAHGERS